MIDPGSGEKTRHPDLSALVRGEADNDQILATARHLDRCSRCRSELADVVTGHALLTRSSEVISDGLDANGAARVGAPHEPTPPVSTGVGRSPRFGPFSWGTPYAAVALGVAVIVWVCTQRPAWVRATTAHAPTLSEGQALPD